MATKLNLLLQEKGKFQSDLTLDDIREMFQKVKEIDEPDRTFELRDLMNLMERNWKVFIIDPTEEQMATEEVTLFREISYARDL